MKHWVGILLGWMELGFGMGTGMGLVTAYFYVWLGLLVLSTYWLINKSPNYFSISYLISISLYLVSVFKGAKDISHSSHLTDK